MKPKYLISVIGATAIGKTSLSIALAKYFKTEIISCDSRQFYKEMNIGTAVPNDEELKQIKHHFIQDRSIFDSYSVGDFERDAIIKLNELFKKYDIVIMVGGSGLYIDAVLQGLDNFPAIDKTIRETLKKELLENGIESLQKKLKLLDPKSYRNIDIFNKHRLIRAIEICIGTTKPYSSFLKNKKSNRQFKSIKIGISADREIIYNRINQRVDIMMENGLLSEAEVLYPQKNLNALQTVGYKELFRYFDGEITLDFAIAEIKKNTRRFAKRQGTWFRKDKEIMWFDFQEDTESIIQYIKQQLNFNMITHLNTKQLESGLYLIKQSPIDNSLLEMIVIRPDVDERKIIQEGYLDVEKGLIGDNWITRGSSKTLDGGSHPDMQLNIMNSRCIAHIAKSKERWQLAGDQLFIDLNLSDENLPTGTQLNIGEAIIEITAIPHNGCKKFTQRFGLDAVKFVNSVIGKKMHLRGVNAKIIRSGTIKTGDLVKKI